MGEVVIEDICRPVWDIHQLEKFIQDKIREKTTSQGNNQVLQAFRIFDKGKTLALVLDPTCSRSSLNLSNSWL